MSSPPSSSSTRTRNKTAPPKLVTSITEEQARYFSPHIVISSSIINSEMPQHEVYDICETLVDCFFFCLVNRAPAGIYLPSEMARKLEENKQGSSSSSSSSTASNSDNEQPDADVVSTEDSETLVVKEKIDDDDDDKDFAVTSKAIEKLMNQAGGKNAILHSLVESLDNDFFPFFMQVVDSEEERMRAELRIDLKSKGEDTSLADKQRIVIKNPQIGCAFSRRGEMITMGSLEGCGLGMVGVFMNGRYA